MIYFVNSLIGNKMVKNKMLQNKLYIKCAIYNRYLIVKINNKNKM